eukprot:2473030-Amphidinium_carterae.1
MTFCSEADRFYSCTMHRDYVIDDRTSCSGMQSDQPTEVMQPSAGASSDNSANLHSSSQRSRFYHPVEHNVC